MYVRNRVTPPDNVAVAPPGRVSITWEPRPPAPAVHEPVIVHPDAWSWVAVNFMADTVAVPDCTFSTSTNVRSVTPSEGIVTLNSDDPAGGATGCGRGVGVGVGEGVGAGVPDGDGVGVGVGVPDGVGVAVGVSVGLGAALGEGDGHGAGDGDAVGEGTGEALGDGSGDADGSADGELSGDVLGAGDAPEDADALGDGESAGDEMVDDVAVGEALGGGEEHAELSARTDRWLPPTPGSTRRPTPRAVAAARMSAARCFEKR